MIAERLQRLFLLPQERTTICQGLIAIRQENGSLTFCFERLVLPPDIQSINEAPKIAVGTVKRMVTTMRKQFKRQIPHILLILDLSINVTKISCMFSLEYPTLNKLTVKNSRRERRKPTTNDHDAAAPRRAPCGGSASGQRETDAEQRVTVASSSVSGDVPMIEQDAAKARKLQLMKEIIEGETNLLETQKRILQLKRSELESLG